jgi:hypothetical protein
LKEKAKLKNATAILHIQELGGENPLEPHRVQQILNNTDGILKVDINYLSNILSVEYDPSRISLDKIKEAISKSKS